jgi:hypothetical protein
MYLKVAANACMMPSSSSTSVTSLYLFQCVRAHTCVGILLVLVQLEVPALWHVCIRQQHVQWKHHITTVYYRLQQMHIIRNALNVYVHTLQAQPAQLCRRGEQQGWLLQLVELLAGQVH